MALIREENGLELVYSNYFLKRPDGSMRQRFDETYPGKRDSSIRHWPHGLGFRGKPRGHLRNSLRFLDRGRPGKQESVASHRSLPNRYIGRGRPGHVDPAIDERRKNRVCRIPRRDIQPLEEQPDGAGCDPLRPGAQGPEPPVPREVWEHHSGEESPESHPREIVVGSLRPRKALSPERHDRARGNEFPEKHLFLAGNELPYREIASSILPDGIAKPAQAGREPA